MRAITLFTKEKFTIFLVALLMATFLGFGLYHLTKFETVDEHFWKYDRIAQYWEGIKLGIKDGKWKKTHINDKPGVTVALLSGSGLIFEPQPELHRNRDPNVTKDDFYTIYDWRKTERLNFLFRFPLLLFNMFLIPVFYWLIKSSTNRKVALLTTIFIATSPILIGMSQIINPDALLWSFSAISIFSFLALLKNGKKKFLIITAFSFGMAILSKYTANILLPFFLLLVFSKAYFDEKILTSEKAFSEYSKNQLMNFVVIFLSGIVLYGLFMPAALEKSKYLYEGTIGSPASKIFFWPLMFLLVFWAIDVYFIKFNVLHILVKLLKKLRKILYLSLIVIVFLFFSFILINPHLPNPIIPLDDVKEESAVDGELLFPQLEDHTKLVKIALAQSIEMQPFIFSLSPVVLFLLLFLFAKRFNCKQDDKLDFLIFSTLVFFMAYFAGNLYSGVLVNPRYAILLYPLIFFLAGISFSVILERFPDLLKKRWIWFTVGIFLLSLPFLWKIKPFYLNYENFLLPREYTLTDSWGYGQYEAAQYLNSLNKPEDITIWSDRSGIYQFIEGRALGSYKIDLNRPRPDYFVISRRGSIRHKFTWKTPELAPKGVLEYYKSDSEDIVWELAIGGRPKNYIRVVKVGY